MVQVVQQCELERRERQSRWGFAAEILWREYPLIDETLRREAIKMYELAGR